MEARRCETTATSGSQEARSDGGETPQPAPEPAQQRRRKVVPATPPQQVRSKTGSTPKSPSAVHDAVRDMELDTSRHALLPQDKGLLARITNATTGFAEYGANRGTVKGETSAWDKYWVPYCQAMGTPVWRTSEAALYPQREGLLHIGFVIDTWQKMKPRRKADPAPKIQSAVNVLTHIRRRHGRKGYEMPAPTMLKFVAQGMAKEMLITYGKHSLVGAEEGAGGLPCEAPEPGPSSLQGERQLDGIVPHGRFAAEHDDSDGGGVGSPSCALADGSTLMEAISPDALSPHGLMSPAGFGVDVDELLKIVDTSSREQAVLDVLSSPRGVPLITLSAAFDPPAADAGKISGKLSAEACDESLPPAPTAGKRRPCNGTPDHPPSAAAAAAAAAAIATNVPSGPATVPAVGTSSQERKKSARVAAARTSVLPADPSRAHAAGATGASSSGAAGASAEADSGEPAGGICRGEGGGGAGFAYGPGAAFGSAVPQLVASPARAPPLAFEPLHRSPMLLHSPHPPMRMIARSLT